MTAVSNLVGSLIDFYQMLLFLYVLLSWFPSGGVVGDVRRALATLCEPYLSIFRRVVPPIGMVDISPIIALIVLSIIRSFVLRVL